MSVYVTVVANGSRVRRKWGGQGVEDARGSNMSSRCHGRSEVQQAEG